jgi:signal transduction histidine kinase
MEIFRPELQSFPLRAFLDEARDVLGDQGVAQVLARFSVSPADLSEKSPWVSLEFVEALLQDLVDATKDVEFFERAAARGMTAKYIGPLMPLVVAFGTPLFSYRQLVPLAGRFNKTGKWSADASSPGKARLSWKSAPGASREVNPLICLSRLIQMRRMPTLFGLPPAEVNHPECMLHGGDACVYEISWKEPPARRHALFGGASGLVAGLLLASYSGAPTWAAWILGICFCLGGWGLGRVLMLKDDLRLRAKDIDEHNEALDRVTRANEERFADLLEAKAEVDKKVEQRTAELRQATQGLSEALSKLQDLDRTKTDFFNNVSHELRSPLTLILAPLDDLMSGRPTTGGERAAYETIHRNASRLLRLINQLLDLAKIDAGQMRLHRTPTDLPELVRGSLEGFRAAAQKRGVVLSHHLPDVMSTILLDAPWIDSALTNLVANAVRLTPRGGTVQVRVTDTGDEVRLSVSDDGPGIAPADQAKIFERFAQGDSTKRVIGGTGIGLALVREAARLHGGDVELVSEVGKGSSFTLRLPRRTDVESSAAPERTLPSLPAVRVLADEVSSESAEPGERSGPVGGAPLALVVEDNPELRNFIADVLSARYRVRSAADGRAGLALAKELRPDVVVSDVAMPEMDGYELCRRLRSQDETSGVPILLVTARTDVNSVLQGFDAGANDYLLKPFHARELLARVDVHVRLRRLISQLARQERLAALGSLAASVAHNVRNPLSALISGLPAMRTRLAPVVDQHTGELMGMMLDSAERIERMTLDLLDVSRIDRELSGEFAPGAGLKACTRILESRVTFGVQLKVDVDDKAIATGRAGDMNHVFMNVIDNALRAVGSKGIIEVRGLVEGDAYMVTVADSGAGIPPSELGRIFEPFYTTRAAGEGTGLGLSIARQIIEEHAGSITAGVAALGGAVFTIRMPLRPAARAVA